MATLPILVFGTVQSCTVGFRVNVEYATTLWHRHSTRHSFTIGEATKEARLTILDPDEALSKFMGPIGPNRERFLVRLGDTVRRAEASVVKNGRVVVFGEMVAVLWAQGKYEAAIRLEELWNELAQTHSFYLCCAYPASEFQELKGEPYAMICAEHTQVVSAF